MTTNFSTIELNQLENARNENAIKRMLYGNEGVNWKVIAMDHAVIVDLIDDAGLVRSFRAHKINSGPDEGKWFAATLDTKTGGYHSYDLRNEYRDRKFVYATDLQFMVAFVKAHRFAKQAIRANKDFDSFNASNVPILQTNRTADSEGDGERGQR